MENQKKWAGWLIAGLVAAVGVVAIVMTTGTAEPPAATQPPVVTVSPSASASPEATQPTPSPAASGRTANASAIGYAGPVLVRLTLDDSGAISAIDVGGARFLETVGVGSGVREEAFTSQFIGKTPPLTLNQDIDAVSGATLSSQAAVSYTHLPDRTRRRRQGRAAGIPGGCRCTRRPRAPPDQNALPPQIPARRA